MLYMYNTYTTYEDEIEQLKYDKEKLITVNEMWKDSFNYFVNHNQ